MTSKIMNKYNINKDGGKSVSITRVLCVFTIAFIFSTLPSIVGSFLVYKSLAGIQEDTNHWNPGGKESVFGSSVNDVKETMEAPPERYTAFFADASNCIVDQREHILTYRRAIRFSIHDHSLDLVDGVFHIPVRGVYVISFTLVRKRRRPTTSPVLVTIYKRSRLRKSASIEDQATNTGTKGHIASMDHLSANTDTNERIASIELSAEDTVDSRTPIGSLSATRTLMIALEDHDDIFVSTSNDPCKDMDHWTAFSGFLLFVY